MGAPAVPTVKAGDSVKRGDIIAQTPKNALGTTMHASIDGVVTEVTPFEIVIKRV